MDYHTTTTLNEIRSMSPCEDGWAKLLKHLGKTKADDEPLELLTILESNGLDDAMWCLQVPSLERLSRHFKAWCAEQVLHEFEREHPNDTRIRDQIDMDRNDEATPEQRKVARDAARDAALAAALAAARNAARDAARDAALAAARDAALAAALAAAQAAAWAAAWAAARNAARDAARDARAAAEDAQEAQLRKMIG